MNSMTPSSSNNSTTLGSEVRFGSYNFLPHPTALLLTFGKFGLGLDVAIGSLDFRVSTQGTFRLSDLIY
jgi:hypothetical protein